MSVKSSNATITTRRICSSAMDRACMQSSLCKRRRRQQSNRLEVNRLARKIFPGQGSEIGFDLYSLQIECVLEIVNLVDHLIECAPIVDVDQVEVRPEQFCMAETDINLLVLSLIHI